MNLDNVNYSQRDLNINKISGFKSIDILPPQEIYINQEGSKNNSFSYNKGVHNLDKSNKKDKNTGINKF